MVYYFASHAYRQVIIQGLEETERFVRPIAKCEANLFLFPIIKENYNQLSGVELVIIDVTGIKDSEEDMLQSIDMIRLASPECRIIIIAPDFKAGDTFLAKCVQLAVYDLITTSDYGEILKELIYCIRSGKNYRDVLSYKEARNDTKCRVEQKIVDHVTIGLMGTMPRIGVTHHVLVLGNYLRKNGYLTALKECNASKSFALIAHMYDINKVNGRFHKNGLDYYELGDKTDEQIQKRAYNFVVCDYGDVASADLESFLSCDRRIVIAGVKPWEQKSIQTVLTQLETTKRYVRCIITLIFVPSTCKTRYVWEWTSFQRTLFFFRKRKTLLRVNIWNIWKRC